MKKYLEWAFHADTPFYVPFFTLAIALCSFFAWLILVLHFNSLVLFFTPFLLMGYSVGSAYEEHNRKEDSNDT